MTAIDSASLELFEELANIGAWLVIIGVIGEGLEIALKICEHASQNRKFLAWYKKHNFCIEIFGAIFWIIVVAGLVMELKYSGKAQLIVKRENTRITQEAGLAIERAGKANERASTNELQVEQLANENLILRSNVVALELQAMEISNNVVKNDPRNQPIKSMTAQVFLEIAWTNPVSYEEGKTDSELAIFWGRLHVLDKTNGLIAVFSCKQNDTAEQIVPNNKIRNRKTFSMSFSWPHEESQKFGEKESLPRTNLSVKMLENEMKGASLAVPLLGSNELVSASMILIINGSITERLSAPKYATDIFLLSTNKQE